MRPFRRNTTMMGKPPGAFAWVCLATCLTCARHPLLNTAAAQDNPPLSHAQSHTIAVDESQFELRSPTREDDTPGILQYGGYAERHVTVRQSRYRGDTGDATVEVVEHPPKYPYAKHDFLGTFFHGYQEEKNKKGQDAGEIVIPIEYIDWRTVAPAKSHSICVLMSMYSNGMFYGIAGWFTESDKGITTVMLRFSGRAGLPRAVIDEYLKKYPSSISRTAPAPSFESWQADDIAKWITLLQTKSDEDVILSVGSTHLRQYEPGAFGVFEAWNKRSDSNALAQEIDKSIERMKAWVAEREAKKRAGGGRKHDGE